MLEALTTLILVIVGAVLIILILSYGIFITFYPLSKTIKGGIDAIQKNAEEKTVDKKNYVRTPAGQVRLSRKKQHKEAQKTREET